MRLLSTALDETGLPQARDLNDNERPPYAILSHTWANEEILFADLTAPNVSTRAGFRKIQLTLEQARRDGLEWAWIDTACINKDSSAELSEAINAMYAWYEQAQVCYVYLSDFDSPEKAWSAAFCRSRWFKRGWTLQELLAPEQTVFYDHNWKRLGTLRDLADDVATATGIGEEFLVKSRSFHAASIASRMSWAAPRSTTRTEDVAYSLMGLFGVNMPMLYGEGSRAFIRLQEEIMKDSDDQSLFAWRAKCENDRHGLLADSPAAFAGSAEVLFIRAMDDPKDLAPHTMTDRGLRIELPTFISGNGLMTMMLKCQMPPAPGWIRILLFPTGESQSHYARGDCERFILSNEPLISWSSVYVRQDTRSLALGHEAFHYIQLFGLESNVVKPDSSSIIPIQKGGVLDMLGNTEVFEGTGSQFGRDPIRIARQNGLLSAYLVLPNDLIGRVIVLIGSDSWRHLAFDVWEPTTPPGVAQYQRIQSDTMHHFTFPAMFGEAFEPQPPGTPMTKLQDYNVTVTLKTYRSVDSVCWLSIYCYKKVDASNCTKVEVPVQLKAEVPANKPSTEPASKGKSGARGLWKIVAGRSERKGQSS